MDIFRLVAIVGLAAGQPIGAPAQDLAGHWENASPVRVGVLGLTLDVTKGKGGEWAASLSDPVRKVFGIRVSDISVHGDRVKFRSPDLPGIPSYELKVGPGSLNGTVAVQGNALPITMKRTGKANVEITPPSPTVSKELEGDWEGAFAGAGHAVTFHFRNQSDNTVEATMASPDLPGVQSFVRVRQMGPVVELTLFVFGGSYRGTLASDGTQLTGTWMQNPGAPPLPLIMHKK